MRKMQYEELRRALAEKSAKFDEQRWLRKDRVRRIRTKPRSSEERKALVQIALARKEEALRSGEYVILAPRRWRINVDHSRSNSTVEEGTGRQP